MKGKKYPFSAYDKHLSLKMSPLMWLAILFLARPYAIFIMSIANRRDRMGVLETFYGDPAVSFLGALAAIPAIILVLAWIKRQPGAAALTRRVWASGRLLLILASILNIIIIFLPALTGAVLRISMVGWIETIICIFIIIYLIRSTRVRDTFADFPQPPESR